jgi:hypothetical protein
VLRPRLGGLSTLAQPENAPPGRSGCRYGLDGFACEPTWRRSQTSLGPLLFGELEPFQPKLPMMVRDIWRGGQPSAAGAFFGLALAVTSVGRHGNNSLPSPRYSGKVGNIGQLCALYLRVSCGVLRLGNSRPGVDRLLRRSCLDGVEVPTMAESGIAVTKGLTPR